MNFNYPMTIDKDWQKIRVKKITPKKLKGLLQKENFYILDVRPLNFKKNVCFIRGAFLCPLLFLADRYKEIPTDRPIVITDWAMKQSPVAAKFLTLKGYPVFGVLKGGIERWEIEKLPVEKREPTNKVGTLSVKKEK
ncbi:MAG: rhodanese-like domain-containing protein [Desulfobacteraceae bacterium]|nr:rhodanese-like domain-containing protein [Desulfobacteraceae bacterium]